MNTVAIRGVHCPACTYSEGVAKFGVNLCSACGTWFLASRNGSVRAVPGPKPGVRAR